MSMTTTTQAPYGVSSPETGADTGNRAAGGDSPVDLSGLTDMIWPYAIRAAATLRLADLVASGVTRLDDLATAAGADPEALGCLLRYLACRGVFSEPASGTFAMTETARLLEDRHPAHMRSWFDMDGLSGRTDRAVAGLLEAVRTGEPAYPRVFGRTYYEDLSANPRLRASFDAFMAAYSSPFTSVVAGRDWSGVRHVVDVGGGNGAVLAGVLLANPGLRSTLVDLPAAVEAAAHTFAGAGLGDRSATVAGSFFEPLPAGGDAYLLSNVLNDWPDRDAVRILRRCGEAAGKHGSVVVAERFVAAGDDPEETTRFDLRTFLLLGGRGRTLEALSALAVAAGLTVRSVLRTATGVGLMECGA
jgi:hypothetical protein